MDSRVQTARNKFGKMMCAAAVLTTYGDLAGITEEEAFEMARPMSGGRMGTCGAVLAAQEILKRTNPDKTQEVEKLFTDKNGTSLCRELKGTTYHRSCPGCVEDASLIIEQLLCYNH